MGGDGGSIPKRDDLVRNKKKAEKIDKELEIIVKWTYCALSHLPLQTPIVACELGRLYSKDSVIEFLLDRGKFDSRSSFEHIRGLKDIKTLQLTENPAFIKVDNEKGDVYNDHFTSPFICPVTGLEMNGRYKFCYLHKCGCVFAERAFKEVETDVCHKCGSTFERQDIIILNPDDDDAKKMQYVMEQRREKAKLEKKALKTKSTESSSDSSKPTTSQATGLCTVEAKGKAVVNDDKKEAVSKSSKSSQVVKRPGSIQNDPSASKVFKSLFTTSDGAKNATKTHFAS